MPLLLALPVVDDAQPAKGFALLPGQLAKLPGQLTDAEDQVSPQVAGGGADGCLEPVDLHQVGGQVGAEFPRSLVVLLEGGEQFDGQPVADFILFAGHLAVPQPVRHLFDDAGEVAVAGDAARGCRERPSPGGPDEDRNEGRGTEQGQDRRRPGAPEPSRLRRDRTRYLILRN